MSREGLEVADVFRRFGPAFREQHGASLSGARRRAMIAIESCRTAALGGHVEHCGDCGHQRSAYDSCRNRNCPKCQGLARAQWLADRQAELLDVPHFHVVFTVPAEIEVIAYQNQTEVYDILFRAASETLHKIAADPQHLGAEIGFLAVLHTWHKICYTTRIFIFWFPAVVSRPMAEAGSPAAPGSFFRSGCCRECSGVCSCTTWKRPSTPES
jgi:hypothetical protein